MQQAAYPFTTRVSSFSMPVQGLIQCPEALDPVTQEYHHEKNPGVVPARSWKMSDETKKWVTFNHTSDNQAPLLKQSTEEKWKMNCFVSVPGCFDEIECGLLK